MVSSTPCNMLSFSTQMLEKGFTSMFFKNKRNLAITTACVLFFALVAFGMWFYHTHPHFIPASTYMSAYEDRVMVTTDSDEAEGLDDLLKASSHAYTSVYGGEITEAFIIVGCGYDAWATYYATVIQPDGNSFHLRLPFAFHDGDLVYKAFDGSYHLEEKDFYMELRSELALNRMFDVSVTVIGGELSLDNPRFTAVQSDDELVEKLETEEVVPLDMPAVENLNGIFSLQGIDAFQVQEAFATSFMWQYRNWFQDRNYEIQPPVLWIRSTGGNLYTLEVPLEISSYEHQNFVSFMDDPDSWFIFAFNNNGKISDILNIMAPLR